MYQIDDYGPVMLMVANWSLRYLKRSLRYLKRSLRYLKRSLRYLFINFLM